MSITKEETASLSAKVYALVKACPQGRVTTYGWIAGALGYPRGARMVGWIMAATPAHLNIPAQRVISKDGTLTGARADLDPGLRHQLLAQRPRPEHVHADLRQRRQTGLQEVGDLVAVEHHAVGHRLAQQPVEDRPGLRGTT